MRTIRFDYGKTGLEVELPEDCPAQVLRGAYRPALADPETSIRKALREPIGAPALSTLAQGCRRPLIVISDRTRPVPNKLLLPAILEELEAAGLPPGRVTILVGTGLHIPPGEEGVLELVGDEVHAGCRIVCHDAREAGSQVQAGEVDGRTVWMNREYVEADFRIVTGLIEPHLMAGYSGGRKGVCPGVLAAESIMLFHRADILNHPNARTGRLRDNPVNELAERVAGLVPPDFLVNATIDRARRVTGLYAGDWREAWRVGVRDLAEATTVTVAEPADVVITSSAGYPLDTTVYQAIKGVVAGAPVVAPAGVIILVASLTEGVGSREFEMLFREHADAPSFLQAITSSQEVLIDQWQLQMLAKVCQNASVWVYSDGLAAQELAGTLVRPIASVEQGIAQARKELGRDCSILCIPEGPYVIADLEHPG